jgi:predicted ester cyclase
MTEHRPSTNSPMTDRSALRALYKSYIDFCNAHDFQAMEKFYTVPAIRINDEPWTPPRVTDQFRPLVEGFPDWHWEIRHFVIDHDFLSLHFRVTGTHLGVFQGIPPTGKKVETTQFTLYRVVGGVKFDAVWDMTDFDSVMKQIS